MDDPIDRSGLRARFWERFALEDLPRAEWEALCDGCGKCCLLKLEDEDTGEVHYTSVSCRLLDTKTRRCGQYAFRKMMVEGCVVVSPERIEEIASWMPKTCAYRLLFEGKPLPEWHPLITGRPESVAEARIPYQGSLTPEYEVDEDDLEDFVLNEAI